MIATFFTQNLLWSEGMSVLLIFGLGLIFSVRYSYKIIAFVFILLLGLAFWFFRNPQRECLAAQTDPSVLICPSDGTVVSIEKLDRPFDGLTKKIALFLSPLDVHVQWSPCTGRVTDSVYHKGGFYPAFLPKSSELNERNDTFIRSDSGVPIMVRQISGSIAYHIVSWVAKDQMLSAGQKYGMIKFGSRVELFVPDNVQFAVSEGDFVHGGQTVVGHIR